MPNMAYIDALLRRPAIDVGLTLQFARWIRSMTEGVGGQQLIVAEAAIPVNPAVVLNRFDVASTAKPAALWLRTNAVRVLLLGGTATPSQIVEQVSGWLTPRQSEQGFSWYYHRAASLLAENAPDWWEDVGLPTWIVGYSMGGAVALPIALLMDEPLRQQTAVITFGAPRPGARGVYGHRIPSRIFCVRHFNDDDPVRMLPPHRNEIPVLVSLLPRDPAAYIDTQTQPIGGVVHHPTGNFGRAETWAASPSSTALSLVNFCAGPLGFSAQPHSLSEYCNRLERAIQGRVQPDPQPTETLSPESAYVATRPQQRQIDLVVSAQIRDLTAGPQQMPVIGPFTDPDRYLARKRGGIWIVLQRAVVVAIGPGKRRAKQLARSLNRMRTLARV